jgi:hypothetical protein
MDNISRYMTGWLTHYRLCTPEAAHGLSVIDAMYAARSERSSFAKESVDAFSFDT